MTWRTPSGETGSRRPRALTVMSAIMVETPVWGPGGPLGVDELAELGVPASLVERLCAWNDWVWEDWDASVPRRGEPGWVREMQRLAYELQNQLPDVDIVADDVERLLRWNRRFPGPARTDPAWCADGLVLARRLQDELRDVEVHYYEDDDPGPVRSRRTG